MLEKAEVPNLICGLTVEETMKMIGKYNVVIKHQCHKKRHWKTM